jgi:2-amino-4-hydroxy-6-hydroxymethyldihydropteridine diphosphokinase
MNTAVIGVGSNIAPEENIPKARLQLAQRFKVIKESSFVRTKPVGQTNQADFVNGVILIEVREGYDETRVILKTIEQEMGRVRNENKYEPRVIDFDIIIWNGKVVDPDFYSRDFLRASVSEIFPNVDR